MPAAAEILDHPMRAAVDADARRVVRPDRRFAVAARDIEHVGGLAQARQPPAQLPHQRLAGFDIGAQVRRAGRKIAVVQVVRFDPAFDQGPHQIGEHGRIIIDALEQHRLAEQHQPGVGHARQRRARFMRSIRADD